MKDNPSGRTHPPYISWLTLENFIAWLQKEGIPAQIDRSIWETKYSGSTGAQLMTALRYLGLLDGEVPTESLKRIVAADAKQRPQVIRQVIQERYPSVMALDLSNATPMMLQNAFSALGVDGETSRKAQSFFINGCKFAGIELAPSIRRKARNRRSGATKRRRPSATSAQPDSIPQPADQPDVQASAGQSTILILGNGGRLTLSLDGNALTLEERDRQFINDLVGRFQAHKAGEEDADTD